MNRRFKWRNLYAIIKYIKLTINTVLTIIVYILFNCRQARNYAQKID